MVRNWVGIIAKRNALAASTSVALSCPMVLFAFGRYAGVVVVTFRFNLPGSRIARIWNRGQDLWALALPAFIVLKLTGVIDWSWWWVLSPLWISGILLAPVLCALLLLLVSWMRRRAEFNAELTLTAC
jgi:hypothetical protein